MTNKEKFKKIFGFKPIKRCPMPSKICKTQYRCQDCTFYDWWNKEYKPCFVLSEEFEDEES